MLVVVVGCNDIAAAANQTREFVCLVLCCGEMASSQDGAGELVATQQTLQVDAHIDSGDDGDAELAEQAKPKPWGRLFSVSSDISSIGSLLNQEYHDHPVE